MFAEQDLFCPICRDIYKDPVFLQCSHSLCKVCLQAWWEGKEIKLCPVCKQQQFQTNPPGNLALKNVCEEIVLRREQLAAAGPQALCTLHLEKLKLFCLDHQELMCLICKDSKVHSNHRCTPTDEAAHDHRKEIQKALKPVEDKLKVFKDVKVNCDHTAEYIKIQVEDTERQIKEQFTKLHEFLKREEEARIAALTEEGKLKSLAMEAKIKNLTEVIKVLSDTIRVTEEEMRAEDIPFLLKHKATEKRVQRPLPDDPQLLSGALIDVAKHLGNLAFNVWSKMKELVSYSPVILDPNSAHPNLILSDDLTSVGPGASSRRECPDNPERFDHLSAVLGSEGFDTGVHGWDVEVGDAAAWDLGLVAESAPRKGPTLAKCWGIKLVEGKYVAASPTLTDKALSLKQAPQRIRVNLNGKDGRVSFYDADSKTRIHTFTYALTEKLFPYLCTSESVKIVQPEVSVSKEECSPPPVFWFKI